MVHPCFRIVMPVYDKMPTSSSTRTATIIIYRCYFSLLTLLLTIGMLKSKSLIPDLQQVTPI